MSKRHVQPLLPESHESMGAHLTVGAMITNAMGGLPGSKPVPSLQVVR